MRDLQADAYVRIGEIIEKMKVVLSQAETIRSHNQKDPLAALDDEETRKIHSLVKILHRVCVDNDLATAEAIISPRRDDPPQTSRELNILADAVKAELKVQLYLHVPKEKAQHYDSDAVLSETAQLAFPTAHAELQDASNCYALEQDTASVFHSMRAAEIGLWALARRLEVELPHPIEMEQWLVLIDKIDAGIKKLEKTRPKGLEKDADLQFLSDASAHFLSFKNAWRSRTAHPRATFDANTSFKVLNHVRDFFEILTTRLKE